MARVYRTDGAWGSGLGRNLEAAEFDGNTYQDATDIATLQSDVAAMGGGISSIEQNTAGQLIVNLTNSTVEGPFDLPAPKSFATLFKGPWQPSTFYREDELVGYAGGFIYVVLQDHTSDTTFDPGANNTAGNFYQELIAPPGIPTYTAADTTLTPAISARNSYIRCTNAAGCVVTIPNDDDVNFPLHSELSFRQCAEISTGGGQVELAAASGVTINPYDGHSLKSGFRGAVIMIKKVAPNEWDRFGGFEAVSA